MTGNDLRIAWGAWPSWLKMRYHQERVHRPAREAWDSCQRVWDVVSEAWAQLTERARDAFVVELGRGGCGGTSGELELWLKHCLLRARRVDSWDRRGESDAKACSSCGSRVLWRREGEDRVAICSDGYRHACGEN